MKGLGMPNGCLIFTVTQERWELREHTVSDTFRQSHRTEVLTKLVDVAFIESESGQDVDATSFCTTE